MKSYSVKSNAKRFARGIAASYPAMYSPAEPVEVSISGMGWFPALTIIGEEYEAVKAEVRSTCVMVNESGDDGEELEYLPDAEPVAVSDYDDNGFKKDWPPEIQRVGRATREVPLDAVIIDASNSTFHLLESGRKRIEERGPAELATLAAGLPPRVESSAEEIAARRAARRNRIDAEKVNPTPKPVKINKTKIILDLIKRNGGATQEELEAATGWQRHTLRGFIAGTLRKRLAVVGMEIECIRKKGEPTRYMVPMMEADRKGGEA